MHTNREHNVSADEMCSQKQCEHAARATMNAGERKDTRKNAHATTKR